MSRSDYFKPFQHPTSSQTFSDTCGNEQNLFVVAGNEMKRAFSRQPSNYPDIMLSLDAGHVPDSEGLATAISSSGRQN